MAGGVRATVRGFITKEKAMRVFLIAFALAGCANGPSVWTKPGGNTPQEFTVDSGQCSAQANSGSPSMIARQMQAIYEGCMQGKGWVGSQ